MDDLGVHGTIGDASEEDTSRYRIDAVVGCYVGSNDTFDRIRSSELRRKGTYILIYVILPPSDLTLSQSNL